MSQHVPIQSQPAQSPATFDEVQCLHQAMNDRALAAEVVGLFLSHLDTFEAKAFSSLDLNFEMHTLKGAASAVGASEIALLASEWQKAGLALEADLKQAMARFRVAVESLLRG